MFVEMFCMFAFTMNVKKIQKRRWTVEIIIRKLLYFEMNSVSIIYNMITSISNYVLYFVTYHWIRWLH
jgi:hypothetical protein